MAINLDSPLIITGRGGSGTRLLSNLFKSSNIFLGNQINKTGDSIEWVEISRQMLFNKINLDRGTFNEEWKEKLQALSRDILKSTYKDNIQSWGLKLPEMMLFLPEMLDAFPKAKIIHLVRHPISISLRRTHVTSRMNNPVGKTVLAQAYKALNIDRNIDEQEDYLNNAISWEYQVRNVINYARTLSSEQYFLVRYEDMIKAPQSVLSDISSFLGVQLRTDIDLEIDPSRINQSILPGPESDRVWEICGDTACRLDYKKVI